MQSSHNKGTMLFFIPPLVLTRKPIKYFREMQACLVVSCVRKCRGDGFIAQGFAAECLFVAFAICFAHL